MQNLNFKAINEAACRCAGPLLWRILPNGKVYHNEYTVKNPRRADKKAGSFKINMVTGKWADFATGDKGGDFISLVAFIENVNQGQAAALIAQLLGVSHG